MKCGPCGHPFHPGCFDQLIDHGRTTCPLCRQPLFTHVYLRLVDHGFSDISDTGEDVYVPLDAASPLPIYLDSNEEPDLEENATVVKTLQQAFIVWRARGANVLYIPETHFPIHWPGDPMPTLPVPEGWTAAEGIAQTSDPHMHILHDLVTSVASRGEEASPFTTPPTALTIGPFVVHYIGVTR
jgi:hypothetical protein